MRVGYQIVQQGRFIKFVISHLGMPGLIGWNLYRRINDHTLAVEVARLLVVEVQTNARIIDHLSADRRVMELKGVLATGCDVYAGILGEKVRFIAWCVADQVVVENTGIPLGLGCSGINRASQYVVNHLSISWNHSGGFNPNTLIQRIRQSREFVVHDAAGGNRVLGDIKNQVGLAEGPFHLCNCQIFQWILAFAARSAGLNPVHECLGLLDAQRFVVFPNPNMRISMPRWHALGANDFAHHRGEAPHHFIARHRPRPKAALGMANHTLLLKNRRDGVCVADLLMVCIALCKVNQAAHGVAARDSDGLVGEHIGDCVRCIVVGGFGLLTLIDLPVVDRPAVNDLPIFRVNHQHLCRAHKIE